jgi:hypothetical protein
MSPIYVIYQLPVELLEGVIHQVDRPSDLLNLALTCSAFRDVILPVHLEYRVISAAASQDDLWQHLLSRPDLARCVRRLTLFSVAEQALRVRLPRSTCDFKSIAARSATHDHKLLARAIRSMAGLISITLVDRRSTEELKIPELFSLVLLGAPSIKELYIPIIGQLPAPDDHPVSVRSPISPYLLRVSVSSG